MTIGTVCSGIGAPEIAFDAKPLWFSEIEKFPSAVLAREQELKDKRRGM